MVTPWRRGFANRFEDFVDTLTFSVMAKLVPLAFASVVLWQYHPLLVVVLIGLLIVTGFVVAPLIRRRQKLVDAREAARVHAQSVGVAASRLTLIRNGVDSERFVPRPRVATAVPGAPPLVGYVGRLSPEKNPALFRYSAALVHARLLEATSHYLLGEVTEDPCDEPVGTPPPAARAAAGVPQ